MRLILAGDVLALFPALTLGVLAGELERDRPGLDETLHSFREESLASLRARCPDIEALMAQPSIRLWREAYQRFGTKPTKFRPTHEALARRLLKEPAWPAIHPVVDVYLTNQVAHLLPHGGYDRDRLAGDLVLDRSPGGEAFEPLGGGGERTEPGEVVYRDRSRILTRRWNHRDAEATKVAAGTRRCLLFVEAVEGIPASAVEEAIADLQRRLEACFEGRFCGRAFRMTSEAREIALD
jgi:DNA/RNA-binding domain of Phe-tRNA-synthetase-like protein